MNKPLTKERLAEIELKFATCMGESDWTIDAIVDLFGDGKYWRETVKKAALFTCENTCPFCGERRSGVIGHKTDCPWLLAQI